MTPRPHFRGDVRAQLLALVPGLVAASNLTDDASPRIRPALSLALGAAVSACRRQLEAAEHAAGAPDPETAAGYLVDALADLPSDLRELDAAVRRALAS
jgi:hypothetical protein